MASAIFTPSLETPVLCITNHPKTLWLKTTNMYLGHRSDFYAGLHKKAYLCSIGHRLGRLDWMPNDSIPRWLSPGPAGWCWLSAGSPDQTKAAGLGPLHTELLICASRASPHHGIRAPRMKVPTGPHRARSPVWDYSRKSHSFTSAAVTGTSGFQEEGYRDPHLQGGTL